MPKKRFSHVDDPKAAGARLRAARLRAGLSQRKLAFPGCTAAYISRAEAGARVPSLQLLRELGRRLGVSAEYLATGGDPSEPEAGGLLDAELALRLGEQDEAAALFTRELEKAADHAARARALAGLGEIALARGDLDEAIGRLSEARFLLGDEILEHASAAESLGKAYAIRGELEAAIGLFEDVLARATDRDEPLRARFEVLLANALIDNGNFGRASELLGSAIARASKSRDPILRARLFWSQSRLHAVRGEQEVAAHYAHLALAAVELTEHDLYAARAHHLLAYIELERGHPREALEAIERGWPLVERSGDAFARAVFRLEKARALLELGENDEAGSLAAQAADALDGVSRIDAARARLLLADVLVKTDHDTSAALEIYAEVAGELAELRSPLAAKAFTGWSDLLAERGQTDEALGVLRRALAAQSDTVRR